jgi:hypothetical protein
MEEMYKKYYILQGEIGYPRFTTYRRQLSKMVDFAEEIMETMCKIYDFGEIPEIKFQYFIQKTDCKELASGFHTAYLNEDNSVDYHFIGLNFTDAKEFPERIMLETLPHELAHALHLMINRPDQEKNPHGEMFDQICRLIEFQFPQTKLSHKFQVDNWDGYITKLSEDAHSFKLH